MERANKALGHLTPDDPTPPFMFFKSEKSSFVVLDFNCFRLNSSYK